MIRQGRRFTFAIALMFVAVPLLAQQPDEDRLRALEEKLDALVKQAEELRDEIAALRSASGGPAAAGAVATPQPPALTEVTTVANAPQSSGAKVFNPDIAVIGNFLGKAGRENALEFEEPRPAMRFEESEISFESYIDPYAKARIFLAASEEGLEVEEAYAQFLTLPYDLTAKAGRFKTLFGKANTWHTHLRPWVDQPLVIHNFFGDEQLADSGISVSKLLPWDVATMELTAEVYRGDVGEVFEPVNRNDLLYNAHFRFFRDITESSNIELGASWARGTQGELGRNEFAGVDATYRWKPLQQGRYRALIARFEGIVHDSPLPMTNDGRGYYLSADYQFARRWIAGVRIDQASNANFIGAGPFPGERRSLPVDRGASALLTFRPSEFSQLRTQLRRTRYGVMPRETIHEILFQLQFAIGAHGAHTF